MRKSTKLKVIEYIENKASNEFLEGINDLIHNKRIDEAINKIVGNENYYHWINYVSCEKFKNFHKNILNSLNAGYVKQTIEMLNEILNKK